MLGSVSSTVPENRSVVSELPASVARGVSGQRRWDGGRALEHLVHCHSVRRRISLCCSHWSSMSLERWRLGPGHSGESRIVLRPRLEQKDGVQEYCNVEIAHPILAEGVGKRRRPKTEKEKTKRELPPPCTRQARVTRARLREIEVALPAGGRRASSARTSTRRQALVGV